MGGIVDSAAVPASRLAIVGLVLCATARNVLGTPAERLAPSGCRRRRRPLRWNPMFQSMSAEFLGTALLGPVDDPATPGGPRAS